MLVLDDAISPTLLTALGATWPQEQWRGWHHYRSHNSYKLATRDAEQLPRAAMPCLLQMVEAVEDRIEVGCFPDWNLDGAGLHEMPPGGYLRPHLDSDVHPITGWRREYSCVLCLNETWRPNWGGMFAMISETGIRQPIEPKFNRLILFRCTDTSLHEVTRVAGPEKRRTLSIFFWSQQHTDARRPQAEFKDDPDPG